MNLSSKAFLQFPPAWRISHCAKRQQRDKECARENAILNHDEEKRGRMATATTTERCKINKKSRDSVRKEAFLFFLSFRPKNPISFSKKYKKYKKKALSQAHSITCFSKKGRRGNRPGNFYLKNFFWHRIWRGKTALQKTFLPLGAGEKVFHLRLPISTFPLFSSGVVSLLKEIIKWRMVHRSKRGSTVGMAGRRKKEITISFSMEWNIPNGNSVCARRRDWQRDMEDKKKSESFPQRVQKSLKTYANKEHTYCTSISGSPWIHSWESISLSLVFYVRWGCSCRRLKFENKFASPCKVTKVDKI